MHHNAPASALGNAMLAFTIGMQRGRARQAAYDAAVAEGRRQDAINRRLRALELALHREKARNDQAAIRAGAAAILNRLRG